ncbi:hypothetical protein BDR04DRAFT_1116761 [Suillus decipiens]|nr:hypothetical protein BDR04DRAFT_1116761 [Suillus decipiens]
MSFVAAFISHHSPASSGLCATRHLADLSLGQLFFIVQGCISVVSSHINIHDIAGKQQKKKQCLDVQSRVDMLNTKIENVQSDKITQEELKNEPYMVKYNLAQQVNEHKFLKHEHMNDYAEAATAHIYGLEAKNSEICLHEAEVKMHDALVPCT